MENYPTTSRDKLDISGDYSCQFELHDDAASPAMFETATAQEWTDGSEICQQFKPAQMHFHAGWGGEFHEHTGGSEHTFNWESGELEMHVVHTLAAATGVVTPDCYFTNAVIGVMFKTYDDHTNDSPDSDGDIFLKALLEDTYPSNEVNVEDFFDDIDLYWNRYVYAGSLTTSPYSEGLLWTVFSKFVPIKPSTVDLFHFPIVETDALSGEMEEVTVGEDNRELQGTFDRRIFKVDINDDEVPMSLEELKLDMERMILKL